MREGLAFGDGRCRAMLAGVCRSPGNRGWRWTETLVSKEV
jgi:hypothetical protein